jgi:GrpB-like predicted nucleotidyltransferase (UPF0157 family)/FMN phosphatase YigB (HAD superfamily)
LNSHKIEKKEKTKEKKKGGKMKKIKKKWIKYSFREYSKEYPTWFKQEKKELSKLLPNSKIEHIGSTAVPNLGGKGIIDIAIFTPAGFLKTAKKKISSNGYEQWPVKKERKFFSFARYHNSKDNPKKVFHIHITADKDVFETMLAFRDYLLKNPKASQDYAKLKKKAAKLCQNQHELYTPLKNPFIKSSISKARKEMKNKIKLIIFDFGGVLGSDANDWDKSFFKLLKLTGLKSEDMGPIFIKHWSDLKYGKIGTSGFWKDVQEKSKKKIKIRELKRTYKEGVKSNTLLLKIMDSFNSHYKTALLMDEGKEWGNWKIKKFNLDKRLNKTYCSAHLGLSKPHPAIFQKVLEDFKITSNQALLIDNQLRNIDAAEKLGMKTILFKNNKQFLKELKKLGVKIK